MLFPKTMLTKPFITTKSQTKFIPPPIALAVPAVKALEKGQYMTVELRSNPAAANSAKYKKDIPFYKDGTPEEFLIWQANMESVVTGLAINQGPTRYTMYRQTLQGKARQDFDRLATAEGAETVANLVEVLAKLKISSFPKRALRTQLRYFRRFMRKPADMMVREYFSRAEDIHAMIANFPPDGGMATVLSQDERLDIYEQHLPKRWQTNMYTLGYDPLGSTIEELIEQAERQETTDALKGETPQKHKNPKRKQHDLEKPIPKKGPRQTGTYKKPDKYCLIHGNCAHDSNDCTLLKDQAGKMKANYQAQSTGNRYDTKNRYKKQHEANKAEELKTALKSLMTSSKKRKTSTEKKSDHEVEVLELEDFIENNFELSSDADGSDSDSS